MSVRTQLQLSTTFSRAYHAALLLTADDALAERAVMMTIASMDNGDCDGDSFLSKTIQNSIACCAHSVPKQTPSCVTSPELSRVMLLKSSLRHCFVLRVLLSLSEEHAARILHLEPRELTLRTSQAMERLANPPEAGFGRIPTFPAPVEGARISAA